MTKVTVFGEQEEKYKKKPIELVYYINSTTEEIHVANENDTPIAKEVVLLGKAENGMEWIMVINEKSRYKYLYLGHWNDGVV